VRSKTSPEWCWVLGNDRYHVFEWVKGERVLECLGGREHLGLVYNARDFKSEERIYVDKHGEYDHRSSDIVSFRYGDSDANSYKVLYISNLSNYRSKVFKITVQSVTYHTETSFLGWVNNTRDTPGLSHEFEVKSFELGSKYFDQVDLLRSCVEAATGMSLDPFGVLQ